MARPVTLGLMNRSLFSAIATHAEGGLAADFQDVAGSPPSVGLANLFGVSPGPVSLAHARIE